MEDFTEFEQRAAYFDGDPVIATKKGVNILERGSQVHFMGELQSLLDLKTERFYAPRMVNGIMAVGDGPIKTFPLRGIKDSPPYLHDGRLMTLEDSVEFFNLVLGTQLNDGEKKDVVAFIGRSVESIVRGHLAGDLPDPLGWIELGRIAGKPMQFDSVRVGCQPLFAGLVEPMTGTVVDDEEQLSRPVLGGELQQKLMKRVAVKDRREAVREVGIFERDSAENVGGLPHSEGVDSRLLADSGPCLMKGAVEPEARLVFEENKTSARVGFF